MRITQLEARDFRNFSNLKVSLRPRLNFFLGDNGQGKTNLLEAVYLLCRGVSFRPSESTSFLTRREGLNSDRARLSSAFLKNHLDFLVEMSLEKSGKVAFVNGKRANSATLMAHFPTVLFSPESLAAIKEGPDQRRQLIDEILISHDPRQGRLLREYSKALRSRNRLLRNLVEDGNYWQTPRGGTRRETEDSLSSLNRIYFLLSTHLATARIKALKDIAPYFTEAMRSILDEAPSSSTEDISVDYLISGESAMEWSETQVYDALLKRHAELRSQEMNSGSSLVGPHKHDIKLLFAGNDSRFYCSQGQQRALILALKIAQIVYHHGVHQTFPVLLLDDVLSELDVKKRGNLMKFLEGISAQILITSTDLTWSEKFGVGENAIFSVSNGSVVAQE
jgi:DNA replication and repair protein RecF